MLSADRQVRDSLLNPRKFQGLSLLMVKSGRSRGDAVFVLTQAGWTPQEIAYVLRWKLTAVEQVLKCDNPHRWGTSWLVDDENGVTSEKQ